jgi:CBS domain-containing protein
MSVGRICNREVVVVEPTSDAREAARLMRRFHVGDLVIVQAAGAENLPLGILTDRDLVLEVLAAGVDPSTVTVADLVTAELVTVNEEESLLAALELMRDRGIRRLPVVNGAGGLEGLLTMDDLLDLLSEEMADLVALVGRQANRERQRRP